VSDDPRQLIERAHRKLKGAHLPDVQAALELAGKAATDMMPTPDSALKPVEMLAKAPEPAVLSPNATLAIAAPEPTVVSTNVVLPTAKPEPVMQLEPVIVPIPRPESMGLAPSAPPSSRGDGVPRKARPLVDVAPAVFEFHRHFTGVLGALYVHIENEKLYKDAGFGTMADYARRRLRITDKATMKKHRRAGRAAWEFYREQCFHVVRLLETGFTPVDGAPPPLPTLSALDQLPRTLKKLSASRPLSSHEQARILNHTLSGHYTLNDLKGLATPMATPPPATPGAASTVTPPVEVRGTPTDTKDALCKLVEARRLLEHLPQRGIPADVAQALRTELKKLHAAVEAHS